MSACRHKMSWSSPSPSTYTYDPGLSRGDEGFADVHQDSIGEEKILFKEGFVVIIVQLQQVRQPVGIIYKMLSHLEVTILETLWPFRPLHQLGPHLRRGFSEHGAVYTAHM